MSDWPIGTTTVACDRITDGRVLNVSWRTHGEVSFSRRTALCFAYGQYLAVIVLGVAFIERTLAAEFYASDRNDFKYAPGFGSRSEKREVLAG